MTRGVLIALLAVAVIPAAQESPSKHWELTDSETLWFGRYSNCQYGYYALLPSGMIAHAEHPPAPHHGFLISLPDVSTRKQSSYTNSDRYVWANGESNATEKSTLAGFTDYLIELRDGRGKNLKLIDRHGFKFQSVPAIRFRVEYDAADGRVVEEGVVVLRAGTVFELGLRTPSHHYREDSARFDQVLAGIRFSKTPSGQCWNE